MPSTYKIRDDVVWPTDLSLSARPPKLVYLDMLSWINMAEVEAGIPHQQGTSGYSRRAGAPGPNVVLGCDAEFVSERVNVR